MKHLILAFLFATAAAVAGSSPPSTATDDCGDGLAWPSFGEVAESARSVYLVKVTKSVDGIATKARTREVMRGGAPGKVDLQTLRPGARSVGCPAPVGPRADVGDRLLIAYDGFAADREGSVDAVARVGKASSDVVPDGLTWLTLKEARAYERIKRRVPEVEPTPKPAEWSPRPSAIPAIAKEGEELWSCDGQAPGFPISVLDGPSGVETVEGPVFDGLRSALETMRSEFAYEPREDRPSDRPWLLAYEDPQQALFLVRRSGGDERYSVMYVDREEGEWGFAGYADECRLRPLVRHGLGESEWRVDPAAPPAARSSTFPIEVMERECASGRPATGRIANPIVDYGEEAITITVPVRSVKARLVTCPGNPWTPYLLELDEPIGDRVLLDGGPWPPEQRWPLP